MASAVEMPREDDRLLVIGAGLPRTGTNSLQLALAKLLGGGDPHTVYHMKELNKNHIKFWTDAVNKRAKKEVKEINHLSRTTNLDSHILGLGQVL